MRLAGGLRWRLAARDLLWSLTLTGWTSALQRLQYFGTEPWSSHSHLPVSPLSGCCPHGRPVQNVLSTVKMRHPPPWPTGDSSKHLLAGRMLF